MESQQRSSAARPVSASRIWLIAASAAGCLALATASQTYLSMLSHGHSFARLLLWQLGCWSVWAVAAPWVVRTSARASLARMTAIGIGLTLAQALVVAELAIWIQPFVPVVSYSFADAIGHLWWFYAMVDPLVFGLLIVCGRAIATTERSRQLELRESQLEAQLARAELEALRLEIQPHFLFNTLNSIAALIRANDNPAALSMLIGLSEVMRDTLDRPEGQVAPLSQELRLIARYVTLHQARFGDRLAVKYDIDRRCDTCDVPVLLLQPLVENALRHGLAPSARICHLSISSQLVAPQLLRLRVVDDGAGLPAAFDLSRDAGTGLANTRSRLAHLYGSAASLTVGRGDGGETIAEITIPVTGAAAVRLVTSGAA